MGRTIIQLAVDDWTLERLMTFDADAAELEEGGAGESDVDAEGDSPPMAHVRMTISLFRRRVSPALGGA